MISPRSRSTLAEARDQGIRHAVMEISSHALVQQRTRGVTLAVGVFTNLAPEHLEVATEDPMAALALIENAGSVFLGHYTPEPLGDYMAGPNHVLPTGGTARFSSTLGVESFLKRSNVLFFSERGLRRWSRKVAKFARLEGLEAHARSALARGKGR